MRANALHLLGFVVVLLRRLEAEAKVNGHSAAGPRFV
jgi:hypothetical protein